MSTPAPAQVSAREARIEAIDLLRGLCILAVILLHINLRIPFAQSYLGKHLPEIVLKALFWSGYQAVIVFFVISGFLITSWTLKRWGDLRNIDCNHFYRMRFARIMPSLLVMLAVCSVLHLAGFKEYTILPGRTSLTRTIFAALTFHVNWLEARTGYLPSDWDVLWSLSVEEMFYVFFPLLCRWIKSLQIFIAILLAFVVAGPFARTVLAHHNEIWADHSYLSCMDGIALGCLAAIVSGKIKTSNLQSRIVQICGIGLMLLILVFRKQIFWLGLPNAGLDMTVLELGTAFTLIAIHERFQQGINHASWRTAILRWFGRNSYEVYLTHMFAVLPLMQLFYATHQPFNAAPIWFCAMIALAGLLGSLLACFYSEPLNQILRARLLPGKAAIFVSATD